MLVIYPEKLIIRNITVEDCMFGHKKPKNVEWSATKACPEELQTI